MFLGPDCSIKKLNSSVIVHLKDIPSFHGSGGTRPNGGSDCMMGGAWLPCSGLKNVCPV